MLFSKLQLKQIDDEDHMMQEIKKLLSYDKHGEWFLLANGDNNEDIATTGSPCGKKILTKMGLEKLLGITMTIFIHLLVLALLRNSPATRIIASFHGSQVEPLAQRRFPLAVEVQQRPIFQPSPVTEPLGSPHSDVIFPSFALGFSPNPVSEGDDESRALWADSVKKKRKRKMNEHQYKKLRKRMRRQKN
ncbi:hypothetical protein D0Y65_042910 [Glycine soja]|uniref:Small ribosomal subunit protein mS38 n=1 Tax=Glycine soja TaxID=3848 RepID=A0A445GFA3_GLYSO|nr:hypothetical protein D0Y65_042910 [Glycine soja]RZB59905.1 hypothetical protein D0Y65_042910 [Glycine soja]RZB59906.1 hypothetical protein D0Y65_042910 [Glycine soja]RZB59907.1 hypothetical protein D0Y65_042910 [Glycine soja]